MTPTSKTRSQRAPRIALRSFRDGDEETIVRLFMECMADFVGPSPVTAKSWRASHREQGWTSPGVDSDKDCVRLAMVGGKIAGYAVTHYRPDFQEDMATVQELCVEPGPMADAVAKALLRDAEARARKRGKMAISLSLSSEDGIAVRAGQALGFRTAGDTGSVFMVAITNLVQFLREIEAELARRLAGSPFADWRGTIEITSGDQSAGLRLSRGKVKVARTGAKADVKVTVEPEALPRLMMGQLTVGEAYLQDGLSVEAADRKQALTLLDTLFPRMPLYLPRSQWW